MLQKFLEKQLALQHFFKNYRGCAFTPSDLQPQVEKLAIQFHKQYLQKPPLVVLADATSNELFPHLRLFLHQNAKQPLPIRQQVLKRNPEVPKCAFQTVKTPLKTPLRGFVSSADLEIWGLGAESHQIFQQNCQKFAIKSLSAPKGPLHAAVQRNYQIGSGQPVVPENVMMPEAAFEIIDGQLIYKISIPRIPEVYEEVIHTAILKEIEGGLMICAQKEFVDKFEQNVVTINRSSVLEQLIDDVLPHILTTQTLSYPTDVFGPPGLISRSLLKNFVDFWPVPEKISDKMKHGFDPFNFLAIQKLTLKEYVNFEIKDEIIQTKDIMIKKMKLLKPKEYAVSEKAAACHQTVISIGQQQRTAQIIKSCAVQKNLFVKQLFDQLIVQYPILVQVLSDSTFNPTNRITQLSQRPDFASVNDSDDITQYTINEVMKKKPFGSVVEYYRPEKTQMGEVEIDYNKINVIPVQQMKKILMPLDNYSTIDEEGMSMTDFMVTNEEELSQQQTIGLQTLKQAQIVCSLFVKQLHPQDNKHIIEAINKFSDDLDNLPVSVEIAQYAIRHCVSRMFENKLEDVDEKDTVTQLLLLFLIQQKQGTIDQFEFFTGKYLKPGIKFQDFLEMDENFKLFLTFKINIDFIPPDLQQFVPFLFVILNMQSAVKLSYVNSQILVEMEASSVKQLKRLITDFKKQVIQKQLSFDDYTSFISDIRLINKMMLFSLNIRNAIWCGELLDVAIEFEQRNGFSHDNESYSAIMTEIYTRQVVMSVECIKKLLQKMPLKPYDEHYDHYIKHTLIKSRNLLQIPQFIIKQKIPENSTYFEREVLATFFRTNLGRHPQITMVNISVNHVQKIMYISFCSSIESFGMVISILNIQDFGQFVKKSQKLQILSETLCANRFTQIFGLDDVDAALNLLPLHPELSQYTILQNEHKDQLEVTLDEIRGLKFCYFNGESVQLNTQQLTKITSQMVDTDFSALKQQFEAVQRVAADGWGLLMRNKLKAYRETEQLIAQLHSAKEGLKTELLESMAVYDQKMAQQNLSGELCNQQLKQTLQADVEAKRALIMKKSEPKRPADVIRICPDVQQMQQADSPLPANHKEVTKQKEIMHFCELNVIFDIEQKASHYMINKLPVPHNLAATAQDKALGLQYLAPESDPRFYELSQEMQMLSKTGLIYPFETALLQMLQLQSYISVFTHQPLANPVAFGGIHTHVLHQVEGFGVPIGVPLVNGSIEFTRESSLSVKIQLLKQQEMKIFQNKTKEFIPIAKDYVGARDRLELLTGFIAENTAAIAKGIEPDCYDSLGIMKQIMLDRMVTKFMGEESEQK